MLTIRNAAEGDFERIMEIYRYAQEYMIRSGNPTQWGHFYPEPELIRADIREGMCRVICEGETIHGVFAVFEGDEPTYDYIEGGEWLNDEPYVTIHRIAGDGQAHGLLHCAADYCKSLASNVRIDTHAANKTMQHLVEKNGFIKCGIIYVKDGSPRLAYQWTEEHMAEKAEIRRCIEEDIVRTGRFYDSVVRWLDDHINYPRWVYRDYPSEGTVRTKTAANAQYICLDGDTIVGAFALDDVPLGSYQNARWSRRPDEGTYLVIHALAVDPSAHRRGLGTEIIRFCIDKAKAEGYRAIRVDIVPDNAPARSLFEKNGFTYAGDADLGLDIEGIPEFSLYELNFGN